MPRREPTVIEQECIQCNAVKPAKDFDKNGSGLNGLRRACKACMKVRLCALCFASSVTAVGWHVCEPDL